ncbi:MAG: HEAT repeat domain-containing protein [Rhodothermus sp.]|nr:HEAT repeat domain-containing protein [Rhodothermus sp.]
MRPWVLLYGLLLPMVCVAQPVRPSEQLLRALKAVQSVAQARPVLQELVRALEAGYLFGQEASIGRLTLGIWRDPAAPPEVRFTLRTIYGMIAPALAAMDPALAETLLVQVPLTWVVDGPPGHRELALDMLKLAAQEPLMQKAAARALRQTVTELFQRATGEAERQRLLDLLVESEVTLKMSFPPDFIAWLRTYRGPYAWKLPDILAVDTTDTGSQVLIALALDPPPLPPEQAVWISTRRYRQLFLEKLQSRRLSLEQKRRLLAGAVDPTFLEDALPLLRAWIRAGETLPPPPVSAWPTLETWAVQPERCEVAVHLLAAAGREGLVRLFRLVQADKRVRNLQPCAWDRWRALWTHADPIAPLLEEAYQSEPAPWLLRLLARVGHWDRVLEALHASDPALRREAAFLLGFAWIPPEDTDRLARLGDAEHGHALVAALQSRPDVMARARQLLRAALEDTDEDVRRQALEALLLAEDVEAEQYLLSVLGQSDEKRGHTLQLLSNSQDVPLPERVVASLVRIARYDPAQKARLQAIEALRRARPGTWRAAVEPEIRSLLNDADAWIRRYAAAYFVAVPAEDTATTAALLAATRDPGDYVRHEAAKALGQTRAFTPELVAALAARLEEGDAAENVVAALESAYLHALRREPGSVDRLLAILLHREGEARWRRALLEGPPALPEVAQALLERLAGLPLEAWTSAPARYGPGDMVQMLREILAAEADPPALVLVRHLVAPECFDAWLVGRVVEDQTLSLEHQLRLLQGVTQIPEDLREAVWQLFLQAVRAEIGDETAFGLLAHFGFAGTRRLVEALWDDPPALQRAARYLLRQENLAERRGLTGSPGGPRLPVPQVEDLPWIEATLARIPAGKHDPRLAPLVELLRLYELGNDVALRKAVFQTRIPELLYRHLEDPVACRGVAHVVGRLHGRQVTPRCE